MLCNEKKTTCPYERNGTLDKSRRVNAGVQEMQLKSSNDDSQFMDLARGLLRYERRERLTAEKALQVCPIL